MRKNEIEFRDEILLVALFLKFSDSYDSDKRIEAKNFSFKYSSERVRFLIATLLEGIKAVSCVKFEFETGDKSK